MGCLTAGVPREALVCREPGGALWQPGPTRARGASVRGHGRGGALRRARVWATSAGPCHVWNGNAGAQGQPAGGRGTGRADAPARRRRGKPLSTVHRVGPGRPPTRLQDPRWTWEAAAPCDGAQGSGPPRGGAPGTSERRASRSSLLTGDAWPRGFPKRRGQPCPRTGRRPGEAFVGGSVDPGATQCPGDTGQRSRAFQPDAALLE